MSDGIIELNRRFVEFSDGPTGLQVESHLWVTRALGKGISWDELLENRWTVILGEAGTGKSKEFEFRAKRLRETGRYAFFMDITQLANQGPRVAVSLYGLTKELDAWHHGEEDGFFFLDSVDEAKLRQRSLHQALSQLSAYMEEACLRARLIVSCRVSDWSTDSDRETLVHFIAGVRRYEQEHSRKPDAGLVAAARRLVDELATVVHDLDDAKRFAVRAGFLAKHLPVFKTAATFWNEVVEQAIGERSTLEALVRVSINEFPYRSEFREIEQAIEALAPTTPRPDKAPAAPSTQASAEDLRVIQIMPFDDEQVRRFAEHRGATNVDALLEAVREAGAQPFIARPLDVEWLLDYWADHNEIGSWEQLVERSISKRLEDRRPGSCPPSVLEHDKAREGLRRLAAIAILSGRWSFLVPGERYSDKGRSDTLDPREILTDGWSERDIRELLTRAVFDESTYGSIRLHHRTVQEHLAAEWLREQIGRGLPHRDLDRLLFRMVGGHRFVPNHLLATAGWLALWNERTRKQLIDVAPEILMEHGDPGSLPAEARARALSAYLARYAKQARLFDVFDGASLARFAPVLGDSVKQHFARSDLPEEAIEFLLELVEHGKLTRCCNEATTWATNTAARSRTRRVALRATNVVASRTDKQQLIQMLLSTTTAWNEDVAGTFASEFFPNALTIPQLGQVLARTTPGPSNHINSFKVFIRSILPKACPAQQRLPALRILTVSTQNANANKSLLQGLQELACVVINALQEEENPPIELQDALKLIRSRSRNPHHYISSRNGLKTAVAAKLGLRRWLFWLRAEELKDGRADWPSSPSQLYDYYALSEIGPEDATWLAEDARSHSEPGARNLAFLAILSLHNSTHSLAETISSLTEGDEDLAKTAHDVENRRSAPRSSHPHEIRIRQMQEEEAAERRNHAEGLRVLTENIENIRSGQHRGLLGQIYARYCTDSDHYGIALEKLEEDFGPEIASATRTGFIHCWRNHDPKLPFEQEEWNSKSYDVDVIIGLVGLELAFEDGLDVTTLSQTEITRLTRYAVRDRNKLPAWFETLAATYLTEVVEALRPAIAGDLRLDNPEHHAVFLRFDRCVPSALHEPLARIVLEELEATDPRTSGALDEALHKCRWLPASENRRLALLCESRISNADSQERRASWWATWVRNAPVDAVCHLESRSELHEIPGNEGELGRFLEAAFAMLAPDPRLNHDMGLLATDPEALERLVPIAYRAIPPHKEDDTDGLSVVTRLDEAQRLRDRLIGLLAAIGTPAAVAALERLAAHPVMQTFRDYILSRVGECVQQSAQARPMSPAEALGWCGSHALPIRDASDLHRVVLDRLDDVKYSVERGERNHLRTLFNPKKEPITEAPVQHWLSEEIERLNAYGYSLPREEEVDRQKRPDIRIHHSTCAGHPITIEIKIAERWTFVELLNALHVQLVGQYLRPDKSRHGIFLLCSSGPPKDPPWTLNGAPMDFTALVGLLRQEARTIVSANAEVDALDVVGIDFH
jgi:Effector-associated domain 1